MSLKNPMLFLVNCIALVALIDWFLKVTDIGVLTNNQAIDKLILFNSMAIRIRNSVILGGLFYLTYGSYKQYIAEKQKVWLFVGLILSVLLILFTVGVIIAASFII